VPTACEENSGIAAVASRQSLSEDRDHPASPGRYLSTPDARPLFRFAVVSDTHMIPERGETVAPWEVNKLANDRARWVVEQIARSQADFVIHLGEVVHPFPHLPAFDEAARDAMEILSGVGRPLYFVPGNHDVGDKKNPMMPAHTVDDFSVDAYRHSIAADYGSFDHRGAHFVLTNCELIGSGLARERQHAEWLAADLAAAAGKRIFLFTHYPPFIRSADEPSYYDNLDEPGRSWLLDMVRGHDVEAVFSGHVHYLFYQRLGAAEIYSLPSTSFVRQDYSEMLHVDPGDQFGRNDVGRLGWCEVDVFPRTHVVRVRRTAGKTLKHGEALGDAGRKLATRHTKDSPLAPVGVHLRHCWAATVDLPYNGPQDEFARRRVRDDAMLFALWETGIRKLRVPLSDLLERSTAERMRALHDIGHAFTVFSFGAPDAGAIAAVGGNRDLIDTLEIVLHRDDLARSADDVGAVAERLRCPVSLAKLFTSAEARFSGSKFAHMVSFGFAEEDIALIRELRRTFEARLPVGFTFRVAPADSPWSVAERLGALADELQCPVQLNIQLGSEDPAKCGADDLATANRVMEAVMAGVAFPRIAPFLDTFVDHDRGFFPRHGLYTRRFDPRLAGHALAHLQTLLNDAGGIVGDIAAHRDDGATRFTFGARRHAYVLLLPKQDGFRVPQSIQGCVDGTCEGRWIDLGTGAIESVRIEPDGGDGLITSNRGAGMTTPCVLEIKRTRYIDG
jgi:predicted phosphodiesterase